MGLRFRDLYKQPLEEPLKGSLKEPFREPRRGLGFRTQGSGVMVYKGFRIWGLGFRVWEFRFRT